jgi:(2Fe-2S) ferredoxin
LFAVSSDATGIVVCRGCCCGSAAKRPQVDHAAVLSRLREFAADNQRVTTVRTSECLRPCEQADVVVVRPSPEGRRRGGRPVWFGLIDEQVVDVLLAWVAAGGPGLVPVPDLLVLHEIDRPAPVTRQSAPVGV